MKHYILIVIISIISVAAIISNSVALVSKTQDERTVEETTSKIRTTYTLKNYKGQLALFIGDSEKPAKIYEIFTDSLPEADKKILSEGISTTSEEEIIKLVEEYTS